MSLNCPAAATEIHEELVRVGREALIATQDHYQAMWDRHRKYLGILPRQMPKSRTDYRRFCDKLLGENHA